MAIDSKKLASFFTKRRIAAGVCCVSMVSSGIFAGLSIREDQKIKESIAADESIASQYVTVVSDSNPTVSPEDGDMPVSNDGMSSVTVNMDGEVPTDSPVSDLPAEGAQSDSEPSSGAGVSGGLSDSSGGQTDSVTAQNGMSLVIDFDSLKAQNNMVKGWIYQPGTNISFPVVQGSDNESWLWRGLDGNYDLSGTVFIDYRCDVPDGNNLILYGHSMTNATTPVKFSSLENYLNTSGYADSHPYFEYYDASTGAGQIYDVFSAFTVDVTDAAAVNLYYQNAEDYSAYLDALVAASEIDTGVTPSSSRQVLVMSTCVSGDSDLRCIVCAIER